MKTLILLRGLPGAGKSTLAGYFSWLTQDGENTDMSTHAADDYMLTNGTYQFDSTKLEECHVNCQNAVEKDMVSDVPLIVVHNTLTTEKEIEPYYYFAQRYGYRVHSLIVENRHEGKNLHQVPEGTIMKMRNRFSIKL